MRNGILAGGNWIIDEVKVIDTYPEEEKLGNILAEYSSNGGSAYNVLKDLSMLEAPFPLEGVGLIGEDERGDKILKDCSCHNINAEQLRQVAKVNTSYTQVMTVKATGKRTFFHQRGANALLRETDFNFEVSNCKIFHLGYLLLLDKLDIIDPEGNTGASKVLNKAKELGFITSVDIVSAGNEKFNDIIQSSLPFIDYLFINEYEAGELSKTRTVSANGAISIEGCIEAASRIINMGVQKYVLLHFREGVIAVSNKRETLFQPSIKLPAEKITGEVGAGDAFAAGVLKGIHEEWDIKQSLEAGVCVAASSLWEATCSDSVLPLELCLKFSERYGFRESPVRIST